MLAKIDFERKIICENRSNKKECHNQNEKAELSWSLDKMIGKLQLG